MPTIIQNIIVLAKVVVPLLMLWFPFLGVWSNFVLDVVDGDILQFLGMPDNLYQVIDKSADYWSYLVMIFVGRKWRINKTLFILFGYRTIGQFLFFATGNELMFVYFQNFLEPLVMAYTLLMWRLGSEEKAYDFYKKRWYLIWAIVIGYKLWNDWYLHFANIDMSALLLGINGNQ